MLLASSHTVRQHPVPGITSTALSPSVNHDEHAIQSSLSALSTIAAPATPLSATPRSGANMSEEAQWLRDYATGDESGFNQLVARYQEPAFWIARHVLYDDELSRDVVQDAFIRVLRNHDKFDAQRASFKAWFYQIVRNLAIDELRRKRSRPQEPFTAEHQGAEEGRQSAGLEQAEMGTRIRFVIDQLEEPYRQTLLLRDVEGHAAQDVATITDTDYGTTRWRIHEARKRFKALWTKHFGEDVATALQQGATS